MVTGAPTATRPGLEPHSDGQARVRVGLVGCGYVFDTYMSTWDRHPRLELAGVTDIDRPRAEAVSSAYGLRLYSSSEDLMSDPTIDIVVNLTSIESHYDVTKAALLAGKHVYSEKPLCPSLDQAKELVELAAKKGLALSCAPSNALSDSTQTLWKAIRDGAVGDVRIVYAEFDDNPIYLMGPEGWRSPTGAPWPYRHEYEAGCTHEHVGYHLTQLCSIFGPVESVTAFSKQTLPDKTAEPLDRPNTPDFSVACLNFRSGVVARVTCSIGAPLDYRLRVVGNRGMLSVDTYRDYRCPVRYERFGKLSLNARKAISVRRSALLQRLFGVGGRPLKLLSNPEPGSSRSSAARRPSLRQLPRYLKQRQLGQQDKAIGIAELADAIENDRSYFPSPALTLHLTELAIVIQGAGESGATHTMQTTFEPVVPRPQTLNSPIDYGPNGAPRLLDRVAAPLLDRLHKH
jgi:predicted dehydrogenase